MNAPKHPTTALSTSKSLKDNWLWAHFGILRRHKNAHIGLKTNHRIVQHCCHLIQVYSLRAYQHIDLQYVYQDNIASRVTRPLRFGWTLGFTSWKIICHVWETQQHMDISTTIPCKCTQKTVCCVYLIGSLSLWHKVDSEVLWKIHKFSGCRSKTYTLKAGHNISDQAKLHKWIQ